MGIRVLVAFDDQYRTYREVIGAAIQVLRPHVEVTTTGLDDLEAQLGRLDPRVVISSQNRSASLGPEITWVEVPLGVGPRTQVTLETLLEAVDRAERPRRQKRLGTKRGS